MQPEELVKEVEESWLEMNILGWYTSVQEVGFWLLKFDNLQNNMLALWVDRLIDQASDGPSIILIFLK